MLTVLVLFIPMLREQYQGGIYVTWHRPVTVILNYLEHPRDPKPAALILAFIFTTYILVCGAGFLAGKLFKTNIFRFR